jgi:hypothetical protein
MHLTLPSQCRGRCAAVNRRDALEDATNSVVRDELLHDRTDVVRHVHAQDALGHLLIRQPSWIGLDGRTLILSTC